MGLEQRRNRLYYYKKIRVNGRVCSQYLGGGFIAEAAEHLLQAERSRKDFEREIEKALREGFDDLERDVVNVEQAIRRLLAATLIAAHYHTHKGEWRKHRGRQRTHTAPEDCQHGEAEGEGSTGVS